MKEYRGYIFDMDLTVLDTIIPSIKCYENAFKKAGLTFDKNTITYHLARSLKHTYDEFINPKCSYEEFLDAYVAVTKKVFVKESKIYPDALAKIQDLTKRGKVLGIVTNRADYEINQILINAGIKDLFKSIITCDKVKKLKPDPESINLCLKEMNINNNDCVYVGDALNDLKAAKNANIDFIEVSRYQAKNFDHEIILNNLSSL